ncbi:MAG: hypothetical protein R3C44_07870 [Chloroflexota bacterium]
MVGNTAPNISRFSDEQLATELARLNVPLLAYSIQDYVQVPLTPEELIDGLAGSSEARVRMALIPLFLARPTLAPQATTVAATQTGESRTTLVCYYTAAMLLQRQLSKQLTLLNLPTTPLPDHFSQELALPSGGNPDALLQSLARRQAELTGRALNWYGTYHHAAESFLRQVELASA